MLYTIYSTQCRSSPVSFGRHLSTSFTRIPMIFAVSLCLFSTNPCSMGLHGVPNLRPMPTRAVYSAIRWFLNSGPLSVPMKVGMVPDRNMQDANILRTSAPVLRLLFSKSTPWHILHMYVMTSVLSAQQLSSVMSVTIRRQITEYQREW